MESCGRSAENLSGGGGLNGSSLLEQVPPRHSPAAAALVITVVTFIMALTILGNVLVVVAVFTSRALRAPQNLFLVSLSSADILVAALVIPFTLAHEVMGSWYFGSVWCGIYLALDVLFCTSSIVHLCAISLDRYWSVTRAVQYNLKRTPKRIKQMIGVVWLISGVISLPPLAAMDPSHNHTGCCDLNSNTWYVLSSCVVSFFAPCVIMVSVYFRIYRVAKQRTSCVSVSGNGVSREASQPETCFVNKAKVEPVSPSSTSHQRREELEDIDLEESLSSRELSERKPQTPTHLASNTEPNPGWSRSRTLQLLVEQRKCPRAGLNKNKAFQMRERRFTVVLAVVIGVFVVCWFPFFFTYSLKAICGHSCSVPDRLFGFFFWLGYCNSSLNPIIYTIFNRDFRKAFKRILFRTRERPL